MRVAAQARSKEAAAPRPSDPAVLAMARAMARLAAREDHAAEIAAGIKRQPTGENAR